MDDARPTGRPSRANRLAGRPCGWVVATVRWTSAAGGAVELLSQDVCVSSVPGGLTRHVGHDPPQRVTVTVDRDCETRVRVTDGMRRTVAVADRHAIIAQHIAGGAVGRHGHAVLSVRVPRGPDEVVAKPEPFRLSQVLDETQNGRAAVD